MIDSNSVILRQNKNAKSLNLDTLRHLAIILHQEDILHFNRNQMRVGKNKKGKMRDYSSEEYARHKESLSTYLASYPTPDLFLTGLFQSRMFLKIEGKEVRIDSSDEAEKVAFLKREFEPFDLNKENQEIAQSIVTDTYLKKVYEGLNS